MSSSYSVAGHWSGEFDDSGLQEWAAQLYKRLGEKEVSLGLAFITPRFFNSAKQVLEIIRVHARVPLLAGCSSSSLICNELEVEDEPGICLALYSLPGAKLEGLHFAQSQVEEAGEAGYWHEQSGVPPNDSNGWLVFIDPFHLDSERWLRSWNNCYAPSPVLGGLASGEFPEQRTQVYLNGEVYEEGGVAISVGGDVRLASVISQGCTPIGETWTLTQVEKNLIHRIGNRPAYEVLAETFHSLSAEDQERTKGNLFVGLVINEYLDEFHRGDFLVRNLLEADPSAGWISVGAFPRVGQTLQFQRRDAEAATEDLKDLVTRTRKRLGGATIYGGCLCSCNGRGRHLFTKPNHDAAMVQGAFGPTAVAGFFCNGEIGPVGEKNFLHGYTASLALFVEKK